MALNLILMRHAKSSWDSSAQDDFDRPLNSRGRKNAPLLAEWLKLKGHLPDVALLSSARRTVETWEHMAAILPETVRSQSVPALYLAEPKTILAVLQKQASRTVMIIGHNPGFALVAQGLLETPPQHPKFLQYPTAATAVFGFELENWSEVRAGCGKLIDFATPHDFQN